MISSQPVSSTSTEIYRVVQRSSPSSPALKLPSARSFLEPWGFFNLPTESHSACLALRRHDPQPKRAPEAGRRHAKYPSPSHVPGQPQASTTSPKTARRCGTEDNVLDPIDGGLLDNKQSAFTIATCLELPCTRAQ